MRRRLRAARWLLLTALGAPLAARAQTAATTHRGPISLDSLAARWSGSGGRPVCQSRGPRGEYLGPIPGSMFCRWPTAGAAQGEITGQRNAMFGLGLLQWERTLPDSMFVRRLADSLGVALRDAGLAEYSCRFGGRRWLASDLAVHLAPAPTRTDGRVRVMVFATRSPAALPTFMCPDAPQPARPVRPTRPRATSTTRAAT